MIILGCHFPRKRSGNKVIMYIIIVMPPPSWEFWLVDITFRRIIGLEEQKLDSGLTKEEWL